MRALCEGLAAQVAELKRQLDSDLGGIETFKNTFKKEATEHFASGWAWLVSDKGKLKITIVSEQGKEAVIAMLACARIGAAHSVIFGGFAPTAISERAVSGSTARSIRVRERTSRALRASASSRGDRGRRATARAPP